MGYNGSNGKRGNRGYKGFSKSSTNFANNLFFGRKGIIATAIKVGTSILDTPNANYQNQSSHNHSTSSSQTLINIRGEGLKEYNKLSLFLKYCTEKNVYSTAVQKLRGRASRYLSKGVYCGETLYQFIERDLNILIQNAVKESTKKECRIALSIIDQLKSNKDYDKIIDIINSMSMDLHSETVVISTPKKITIPDELFNNPNGSIEAEEQTKTIFKLSEATRFRQYSIHVCASLLKIFTYLVKYPRKGKDINLFDYLLYMLNANIDLVKKEQTKKEYRTACKIIYQLKNNVPINDICTELERM